MVASFADLGQSHPKTLRLTSLSRLGGPCQLGTFDLQPINELGHELELPNVVFKNFAKYDLDQLKYLFQKWSHLDSSNSLSNYYLSSKYGIDDFSQFWIDNWENSTDPLIQKILDLNNRTNQCLINMELQKPLFTNTELISEQQKQLLENEVILDLDARITNETAAQMLRQNSDWLDASIERANAQLAEANFQVLEDRLDTSVELEISNHLQQMDWTDWELSNQISHLHKNCITSKRGGFLLTSGTPEGSGGSSGYGGSGGRGFGNGGSGEPPSSNSGPEPKPPNNRLFFLLAGFSISYAMFLWFQEELKHETENRLDQFELEQKKKQADLPAKTEVKPKEGLALAALRQVQGFGQGGLLLLCGLVSGRETFIRAFHLIALRALRQVARALVPSFLQTILGPLVGIMARFGLGVLPPISRILCFFVGLDFLKRLLFIFISPELMTPIVPFLDSIVFTVQGFFATPRDVSVAAGFLEKNIKVLSCTLLFGGMCSNFLLFFQEDNQRVRSFFYCSLFGISIFIIFNDHKFIGILVQNIIQTFPSIQQFAQRPSGQAC